MFGRKSWSYIRPISCQSISHVTNTFCVLTTKCCHKLALRKKMLVSIAITRNATNVFLHRCVISLIRKETIPSLKQSVFFIVAMSRESGKKNICTTNVWSSDVSLRLCCIRFTQLQYAGCSSGNMRSTGKIWMSYTYVRRVNDLNKYYTFRKV